MSPVRIAICTTKQPSCTPNIMLYASRDPNETKIGSRVVITLHTSRQAWYRYSRLTRGLSDSQPNPILPTVCAVAMTPTRDALLALGMPRSCPCWTCDRDRSDYNWAPTKRYLKCGWFRETRTSHEGGSDDEWIDIKNIRQDVWTRWRFGWGGGASKGRAEGCAPHDERLTRWTYGM